MCVWERASERQILQLAPVGSFVCVMLAHIPVDALDTEQLNVLLWHVGGKNEGKSRIMKNPGQFETRENTNAPFLPVCGINTLSTSVFF